VRPTIAALIAVAAIAILPAVAQAELPFVPHDPSSLTVPPPGYSISGKRAVAIARSNRKVRAELARGGNAGLVARPFLLSDEDWLVAFYRDKRLRVQVSLNGRTGKVQFADVGREIGWPSLFHGHHGPDARRFHKILVIAGLLFLLPFLDPRRPFRMLHLDLLAILSLGLSYGFSVAGNVYAATPLMYPPLLYLIARFLALALRRRPPDAGRLTWLEPRMLGGALALLLAGRYAWVLAEGNVNDIGYASVFGADTILNGLPIYDASPGSPHLDSYGPFMYLAYVPFTAIFPLTDLSHTHTDAARAAALFFDLATVVTLFFAGRRLRPGRDGTTLGLALGWAFAACPWSLIVINDGTNDGLIAWLLALTLLTLRSPRWRGVVLGLAGAAKFAPLILAGLFSRVAGERGRRPFREYVGALIAVMAFLVVVYLPDGGLREFWDSTIGFQLHRSAPSSMWGLHPSWKPVHVVVEALALGLAAAAFALPRERTPERIAAAGAALLIALQLATVYWYYFYLAWMLPYALVALFSFSYAGSVRNSGSSSPSAVASNSS
jgi:hypothetical protein